MTKENSIHFPPVVTVLGHVDHGKTSLLDAIRKSNIVGLEKGGITQKIGASEIEIIHEGEKRKITFIDTPGHEAFSKMRGRGAIVADIGLLIVSSGDGVMPQTKESISLLKSSKIPYIVVLTKSDLDTKMPDKVKQQLAKEDVLVEGLGGEIPVIEVSAKTNHNIKELLDLILLVFDLHKDSYKDVSSKASLKAVVIESRLDTKAGPKASVVIKNGTLSVRDEVVADDIEGKVRTLLTDKGAQVNQVTVGDAVEILGFSKVPEVGSIVVSKKDKVETQNEEPKQTPAENKPLSYEDFFNEKKSHVKLILCADTKGSLEAITASLSDEVEVILQKTGEITEADVLLGKSTGALVLGFNAKIRSDVSKLASTEKILMKNYGIIYEMIDEIHDVLEGKKLALEEKIYGMAKILATFPFEKTKVLGVKVLDGRIAKGDKVRILRGEDTIGESNLTSLRQGKDQTSKVEKGQEAGVIITPSLDFELGDVLVCHG